MNDAARAKELIRGWLGRHPLLAVQMKGADAEDLEQIILHYAVKQTAPLRAAGERVIKAIDSRQDYPGLRWIGEEVDAAIESFRALLADPEGQS